MKGTVSSCVALMALFALLSPHILAAQERGVPVIVDGALREVPLVERQGRRFVALDDVASLLGGTVAEEDSERALLAVDGTSLVVRRRMPYVEYKGRFYQMADAAQRDENGYYLPASSVTQLLPALWPERFQPPEQASPAASPRVEPSLPDREVRPGEVESGMIGRRREAADLEHVDVWIEPGRTKLDFRLEETPAVTVDDALPGTLQIRLANVWFRPQVADGLVNVGLVDSVAVATAADGTALTLWLDRAASLYAVSPLRRPAGVEVVVLSTGAEEAQARMASGASARRGPRNRAGGSPGTVDHATGVDLPSRGPRGGDWTIVLDAGHGGHDPGAIGPGGSREKDVALAITLALKEALDRIDGVDVVLTRGDDRFIPLRERPRIANRTAADLFVSIHANSARNRKAVGFETYFLSAAKTEDEKRVARIENAAIRYEDQAIGPESEGDLNFILWDLAQNEYLRESSALAETVQVGLDRRLPLKSRGVKQAGFFVLNGAFMPAILLEMAFISNPQEETLLNDPEFRTLLVAGLAESLVSYLGQYSRRFVGPTAAR